MSALPEGNRATLDSIERADRWAPGPEGTLSITGADAARWTATAEHRDVTTTCSIAGEAILRPNPCTCRAR
jgi:hypothetical protein